MFGVWIMGLPMQDMVSQRWSSVNMKIMFGGFAGEDLAVSNWPRQPVIGKAVVAAVPATSFTNCRLLRFFIFFLRVFSDFGKMEFLYIVWPLTIPGLFF
jgi:hypothetical protein